jgi:hypothetical protein
MSYSPGDIFYQEFTTSNISGIAVNADSTPTATFFKNGIDDFNVKAFVTNIDTGRYVTSGIIPSTYLKGWSVGVAITGYVNTLSSKVALNMGSLSAITPDVNIVSISGVQTGSALNVNMVSISGVPTYSIPNVNIYSVSGVPTYPVGVQNVNVVSISGIPTYPVGVQNVNVVSLSGVQVKSIPDVNVFSVSGIPASVGGVADVNVISISGVPTQSVPLVNVSLVSGVPIAPIGQVTATLASGALDNIMIENNVNARQILSLIGAAMAGSSVVAANNITYYAVNNNTVQRINATAVSGARQAMVIFLP